MSYKRYSEYKDSGIEWIGEIPDRWNTCRLKFLAKLITGNTPPKDKDTNLYYTDQGSLWIKPDNLCNFTNITSSSEFLNNEGLKIARVVPANTPLVCCIGSIGKFGICDQKVAFNQQINAVVFNNRIFSKFGLYYISCQEEQHWFYANGNVVKILNTQNQGNIIFTSPSLNEQQSIASYLDTQCALIDKAIETQNKIIEKLKEYKKSIITEAVTKGLDKNAKMKDSGIEWIGEIPEGWEVRKVKFLFKVISGSTPKSDNPNFWDGDIIWITPTDYTTESKYISDSIKKITEDGLESCSLILVPVNSIIFSKRAPIGLVAISTKELCTNQGCLACIPINVMTTFYYYIMSIATDVFQSKGKGTTFMEISLFDFKNMRLVLPTYKEQKLIVQYLDHKIEQIDKLILNKEQIIEKLQSFKKSLIYECVTGKRRV